ncbi:MAG: PLP-dependent transferase [Planctomycetota bacterium]|nr:MAG: PLP-dependent transferase [Planctomycetota bacterium]
MASRDLLAHPLYRPIDLGAAVPDSAHAVSVALPTWAACIGYEEKQPWVMNALKAGYPRFVTHPLLAALIAWVSDSHGLPQERLALAPSRRSAKRLLAVADSRGLTGLHMEPLGRANIFLVSANQDLGTVWAACRQHAGMIPSSRQCAAALAGHGDADSGDADAAALRQLLATWYGVDEQLVHLAANGMASIAGVHRALLQLRPGQATLQLGFPYVDLLKLQQVFSPQLHFIPGHDGVAVAKAESLIRGGGLAGVFLEVPGNPLLQTPDVPRLSAACREAGVPLVIDDTVASPLNVDLRPYADVVVDSLTKYVAGCGTVMGGAAVVCPAGPQAAALQRAISETSDADCWHEDLSTLLAGAQDYPQRLALMNNHAQLLVQRLRTQSGVAAVRYPDQCPHYRALMRDQGGFGSLCSVLLSDGPAHAAAVYDALQVTKGPSFGTRFTLCCPFTLLAHYGELDWAESLDVSRWLLRFSFGTEDPELTWSRLAPALERTQTA